MLAGCGGSQSAASSTDGDPFRVSATATLEPVQRLGSQYRLRLTIVNRDDERSLPTANATVTGFSHAIAAEDGGAGVVADPRRPNWIIDAPPRGASSAYRDTWSLGSVRAGGRKTFVWRISPVQPGHQRLRWRVSAGLDSDQPTTAFNDGAHGTLDVEVRP